MTLQYMRDGRCKTVKFVIDNDSSNGNALSLLFYKIVTENGML